MSIHACSKDQFLKDVEDHKINVVMDNGLYRHINFSKGSFCYSFNLVTWPGHLCIEGDMGTYVFSRVPDMFAFFRDEYSEELKINTRYWSEKCETKGNIKEFSVDSFRENVQEYIDECWDLDEFIEEIEKDDESGFEYFWTEQPKDNDVHGPFSTKDEAIENLKKPLKKSLKTLLTLLTITLFCAITQQVNGSLKPRDWNSQTFGSVQARFTPIISFGACGQLPGVFANMIVSKRWLGNDVWTALFW